jgi:hypothetical protein
VALPGRNRQESATTVTAHAGGGKEARERKPAPGLMIRDDSEEDKPPPGIDESYNRPVH